MTGADVVPLLRRAWAALRQGQPAPARADCEAALQRAPESFDAWRLYAMALQALGDARASRDALQRALSLRPDDGATALDLGTLQLGAGEIDAALASLSIAMQRLPQEPRAAFRYATAAFHAGDYATAADAFEAAARLKPDWTEAWNNLAAAHGKRQEYAAAIAAARNALQLAPNDASAHQSLAALQSNLFDRQSLQEGLQHALRALQLDPALAEAHRNAAILSRKLSDPTGAEAHARRALELAPRDIDVIDTLGEQLQLNRNTRDAVNVYAQALAMGVTSPTLHRQHGIALLHDGQLDAARDELQDALRHVPDDQRTIAHLGVVEAQHDAARAAQWLGLHRHVHVVELPTPEGFADARAFHDALADDIRRHSQQRWEPAGLAARNAYLSGDLLADHTAAITGFEQRLREAIDAFLVDSRNARGGADALAGDVFLRNVPTRYRVHVWATQAAERGFIDTHIHEDSWLSGAYYVELPPAIRDDDATHAGWIEFGRPFASLPQPPEGALRRLCPKVGTLLLFPSYLFHRTLPYAGSGERISISFDLAAV
ncbi:tetratricopeptide repeat protein [Lysobacter auxotrophicus]|uniref:Tetratricopeptide repeat protein n=1 Tax=Lysobacter auxotrophicus TaxID=2992573 RepID=A0ABM8D8X5_9GAMM|nr:tetratricopeptide repeat protein [Lysobacter auxotrophicus]BDU14999.1 tetratricopeptide repeat protein [Lysobacter auxotrophicus]